MKSFHPCISSWSRTRSLREYTRIRSASSINCNTTSSASDCLQRRCFSKSFSAWNSSSSSSSVKLSSVTRKLKQGHYYLGGASQRFGLLSPRFVASTPKSLLPTSSVYRPARHCSTALHKMCQSEKPDRDVLPTNVVPR